MAAIHKMRPDGTTFNDGGTPSGAATAHECVDETSHDGDATHVSINSSSAPRKIRFTLTPMLEALAILSVTLRWWVRDSAGGSYWYKPYLYINGTEYAGTQTGNITASFVQYEHAWTLDPSLTTAPFTKPGLDVLEVQLEQEQDALGVGFLTMVEVEVAYTPVSGDITTVRETASHLERERRRPAEEGVVGLPLSSLDLELGDDFSFSDFDQPATDAPVMSIDEWRRRLLMKVGEEWDPMKGVVRTYTVARDEMLVTLWDSGESRRSSSPAQDGVCILTTGGLLQTLRDSTAWLDDPGSRLIVAHGINQPSIAQGGRLFEDAAKNYLKRSSAVSGTGGLTLNVGSGSGSAITAVTPNNPLFAPEVTPSCLQMHNVIPGGAQSVVWPASDSVPANTVGYFAIDHEESGGIGLQWLLQRAVDSRWWDDTNLVWAVAQIANTLAVRTTRTQDVSKLMDVGASDTTLQLTLRQTGGGATRTSQVHHVEWKNGRVLTSRVVTDAATYTRAVLKYQYAHTGAKPGLRNAGFSAELKYTALWNTADVTGTIPIWRLAFDADDFWECRYLVSSARFEFRVSIADTVTTAFKAHTVVRGTPIKLVCRAATAEGEHGLAARLLSILVDGVRGTDAARAVDPTEATATMYLGGDGTTTCQGHIAPLMFTQRVISDAEAQRFAA